jgi:hypothetical protein
MIYLRRKYVLDLITKELPPYSKYIVYAILAVSLFSYGYIKGQANVYEKGLSETVKIVTLQGKTTQKVITKYIKIKAEEDKKNKEITHEGQSYDIKFPNDDYVFNNFYVRMHDASITGEIPTLSSGDLRDPSGVSVARTLEVAIHNNIVGNQWKDRALLCESWTKAQEEITE